MQTYDSNLGLSYFRASARVIMIYLLPRPDYYYFLDYTLPFINKALMDCSLPGSSVHRIFQARVLEWGAIAEYIIQNVRQNESQAGIKIAGRNTNNLRYADDTTLMAESEEDLKRLLMRMKDESENAGLTLNIEKN